MELDLKQLKYAVSLAEEKKGLNTILLNLKDISLVTDYFMLVTGNSVTQVKAIADHLDKNLPTQGIPVLRVEGLPQATWVLIDCGDLVVHVMTPETREFYNLERLWGDAEAMSF